LSLLAAGGFCMVGWVLLGLILLVKIFAVVELGVGLIVGNAAHLVVAAAVDDLVLPVDRLVVAFAVLVCHQRPPPLTPSKAGAV